MRGVPEQGPVRVRPGRWSRPGDAVDHLDLPGALRDFDMMPRAEEGEVVDRRGPAVGPRHDMVDLAEVSRDVAAGHDASDVPREQRRPLRRAGEALRPAQVQDGAMLVEQHPTEPSGAGQESEDGGVDAAALLGARETLVTCRLRTVEDPSMRELADSRGDDDLYIRVGAGSDSGSAPDHPFPFRRRFNIVLAGMGKAAVILAAVILAAVILAAVIRRTIGLNVLPSVGVVPVGARGVLREVFEQVGGAGMVPHDIDQGVGATLTRGAVVGQVAFDAVGVDGLAGAGSGEGR